MKREHDGMRKEDGMGSYSKEKTRFPETGNGREALAKGFPFEINHADCRVEVARCGK